MKNSEFKLMIPTAALLLVSVAGATSAPAAASVATLRQVQVTHGSQVDLTFDQKVQKSQVRTEFFNDIIQIVLTDVAVYPAKISSVSGSNLVKIFAYQYAPKLVRCRLTVKGNADLYKDHVLVNTNGKVLTIRFDDEVASIQGGSGKAVAATRVVPGQGGDNSPAARASKESAPAPSAKVDEQEERALLDRVLKSSEPEKAQPAAPAAAALTVAAAEKAADKAADKVEKTEKAADKAVPSDSISTSSSAALSKPLGGGKPLPSPFAAMGKLAAVLALFGVVALAAKRILGGARPDLGALSKLTRKGLGRKEKMIEVLSTHYLGPKKSIAVVKVGGRTLVLGVTAESINLITQLPGGASAEAALDEVDLGELGLGGEEPSITKPHRSNGTGATAAGPAIFSEALAMNLESRKVPPPVAPVLAQSASRVAAYGAVAQGPASGESIPQHLQQQFAQNQQQQQQNAAGVRAQIRSRLEGLKQL